MCTSVAEYYEGQSIFITGGTGFLGKVLLEKLLYNFPGIDKVYILIRKKKNGLCAQQRVQQMLDVPIFSKLKEDRPDACPKIIPIQGDIAEPKLGISAEDEELLINKVTIVFHVAATVKFDEPLEVAIKTNVVGTELVLDLSRRMRNIKAFVYVSTAYSNSSIKKSFIGEHLYPPKASLDEVKGMLANGVIDNQIKDILKECGNTYVFSKSLAENVVAEKHGDVPTLIVRPSIVMSCYKGPIVGWVDTFMAILTILNGVGKGWCRLILGCGENVIDLIPADYVSNLIIVAASKIKSSKEVEVYNSCTSSENPITQKYFLKLVIDDSYKNKSYDLPVPFVLFTRYKWLFFIYTIIFHTVPAYIADAILMLRGKKTRYTKLQAKSGYVTHVSEYFSRNSWMINSSKTRALADSLSATERKIFPFDPADIVWENFIPINCMGVKQFLSKKSK